MRKLYLQLITAFVPYKEQVKAGRIFFLAFILSCISYTGSAQLVITPAHDTLICTRTAANGSAPAFTTLGNIVITETAAGDFLIGANQITLDPPSGWQFNASVLPVITVTPVGGEVSVAALVPGVDYTPTMLRLSITTTANVTVNSITISGLQVQANLTTSLPGCIFASTASGMTGGITTGPGGTCFGKLAMVPLPVTGPSSVCVGATITMVSTAGAAWTSSNPAIASVNPITGIVTGNTAGTVNICATVAGCTECKSVTVFASAPPITGAHNMCAWFDSLTVSNTNTSGVYSATLVTVVNSTGTGTGRVYAHAPGIATVTYILPTGCSSSVTITVNPLPTPILAPPYAVCQGSTATFTSSPGGGTWSTGSTTIATVGSSTGTVLGMGPGITDVIYTLPTGCKTDTPITVYPLPTAITGDSVVCVLSTITAINTTGGGTWSIAPTSTATINSTTGLITGVSFGIATVTYTMPTGCFVTRDITVNALPASISGADEVCVGDSILVTSTTGGGRWTSSFPTIATVDPFTGYVVGVDSGVTTIFYTLATGCRVSHNVTVNPLPAPITAPSALCVGGAGVATSSPSGGSWGSSTPTVATIDPSTGVIVAVNPGTTTICYTLSSTTGCSICYELTVNPNPAPISGLDSLCQGDSITLSNSTPGGTWTSGDPSRLSIDPTTGVAIGILCGPLPVTITYTTGAGCFTTIQVTVHCVPAPMTDTSVCAGDSILLTNATPGGTWSSAYPAIATINPVTGWAVGITAGTTPVTYTGPGGCFVIMNLTVNPNLPITGPNHVCQGDDITLINGNPGGTWFSSNPGIATVLGGSFPDTTAAVHGVAPGVVTITYTLATGCSSTFTVTVDPMSPITGFPFVCVGSTTSLSNATPGGLWSSGSPSIATVDPFTGVVTGTGPGVVIITYSVTATGCSNTFAVTVNPLPAILVGDSLLCQGDTLVLTDSTLGGTFSSSNNAIATVGITTGVVTGIAGGTAIITYTISTGCYVTHSITVNPITPITGPDSVCVGSSILLIDTTAGGTWSSSDTTIALVNPGGVVTGLDSGVVTISYTMPSGCFATHVVSVNPLPGTIIGPNFICVGQTTNYADTPSGGTWTSSNPGIGNINPVTGDLSGVSAGVITITYTLPTTCYVTKVVSVYPTPAPIVGPRFVCIRDTIRLTNPSPGGIWSHANPAITFTYGSIIDTVVGIGVGVDTIYYTFPLGSCSVGHAVTVTPIPVITVTPNPSPLKCKYATVTLSASGAGPGGTYTWSPSYALSCTNCPNPNANPTITTTYTVTGTSQYGCDSFTTVIVYVDDSLNNMKIVAKDSICNGTCDTLKASGRAGSYFNWHPATGLSCTICDTVVACPNVTTTYWAVAIDDLGCKDSVSFTVWVNPIPVIEVTPFPAIVCRGKPTQLHASSPNTDNATNVYTWGPNLFISCDTCPNPIITDTANIIYRVRGTTKYGCYDSLDVKVSVLDTNVNTIVRDTNICIGDSALLIATSHSLVSNLDIPTFTWMPSAYLSDPFNDSTYANPPVTTTYSVAIHANYCWDDTLSVTVFVEPYPNVSITAVTTSQSIVAGTPIQLIATVTNTPVGSFAWTPPNTLTCDSCYNPIAIPTVQTTYTVTVTSIYGCISTDTITLGLFCDNSQVFIPNTFTPNGDGVNDRFFVSGKGLSRITLLQVLNRWGQVVYEVQNVRPNDAAYGWDGTFKGKVLSPDVFIYIVKAECALNGTSFTYTGDISLVK